MRKTRKLNKPMYELLPGGRVRIPLTKGFLAVIDARDFRKVIKHGWSAYQDKQGRVYAVANVIRNGKWTRVMMHRLIMGFPLGLLVDHKDMDGRNNTRENLRLATRAQNSANAGPDRRRGKTSRFRGVSWSKSAGKWLAQIMVERKYRLLGYFDSEEVAARAYDAARKKASGEFARLNFPV